MSDSFSPTIERQLQRLAGAGIRLLPLPALAPHFALERDGFAAIAEHRGGVIAAGSAGIVTEAGFAVLLWRDEQPFFRTRTTETPATPDQVRELRAFAADLEEALRAGGEPPSDAG